MALFITCDHCRASLQVLDEHEGRKVRCPKCRGTLIARPDGPDPVPSSLAGPAGRPCRACGGVLPAEASFCPACGRASSELMILEGSVSTPPPPPAVPQPVPVSVRPPEAARRTSGLATASLICGILALPCFMPGLPAIPAIVCGHLAHNEIAAAGGRLQGRGQATAGLVLGYVNLLGGVAVLLLAAVL